MLGADLMASAPSGVEVHGRDRASLDITDSRALTAALDLVRPEVVINATGYTAVDRAELAREEAFALNATAVANLGMLCAERGAGVVHFSTDYVFDGSARHAYTEENLGAPLNVYGQSKLAGEQRLLSSGARSLILRTQWLFGVHGASFPRTMWERATRRQPTRVVDDQRGRPTYTVDLARTAWELVVRRLTGIYHVANSGEATWYDVARRVFDAAGVPELLSPCTSDEFPRPAKRPPHSILNTTKLEQTLAKALPPWSAALAEFLGQLRSSELLLPVSRE
jgi:dTDP-4-dehydrorhamnose reductase